ncbi:hypothetical protein EJV46_02515 [Roseococcus sp. SYP-B2431]|uniref:hypothetical protein n=1 Tax=Roseococcus sp. SYP-B2431 TaxID=2496640 RepID=UPI00103EB51B|nr:hypothetical protein [Roseococcus sp. SYP-B2431]TCH99566.1 hypothetical protein EJV46_02515 [Roseococcus sp. SYP-B2431]
MKPLFAMGAMLALAACETGNTSRAGFSEMFPLLDNTGRIVGYAPPSAAQGVPPGTAIRMNINGTDQLVTLGPRVSPPTSAGTPVIIGTDNGRPIIGHIGQGTGNLAPGGIPVVTGTQGVGNRPTITYVQPGQQAPQGTVAGRRGSRNVAPTAPGELQPGTPAVVQPAR